MDLRVAASLLAFLLLPLAACNAPSASDYVQGVVGAKPAHQIAIGTNAVGEACTQTAGDTLSTDIYCGTWQEPSAHVHTGGPGATANLARLATSSPWRVGLDRRFRCGPPTPTTIVGNSPAELMQCTQLVGGWGHVAMVASVNGAIWYADGVLPAAGVMERAIGVMAGSISANAAPVSSAADALFARRLAARAFSSGDVGQYDTLMAAGTRANLADDSGAAEVAFRAALAIQRKALGRDNPNTATPLMSLALELSDEGRFSEATALFAQAETLVTQSADPTARARLLHYRGLDAMNQGKLEDSLSLLTAADAAYAAGVPQSALQPEPVPAAMNPFARSAVGTDGLMPNQDVLTDPRTQNALLGLIEVRRNRAIVLRVMGHAQQADRMLSSATTLADGNDLARPLLNARLFRTTAMTAAAQGKESQALSDLKQSAVAFDRSLPGSKPLAETYLLRARELYAAGDGAAALPLCRGAVNTLAGLQVGTTAALVAPCLDVYAREAAAQPARQQELLAEMFTAAQLAQSSVTSQQIAQASATLAEYARDPRVGGAIRQERDLKGRLDTLYSQRDDLQQLQKQGADSRPVIARAAALDQQIQATRTQLQDAESALQAASPTYGQLVQEVASAADVFRVLHPGEAFASFTLSDRDGWVFLLRDNRITVSRIPVGTARVASLVQRIRDSIEITPRGLPAFDVGAAAQLYQFTLGGVAPALLGANALVVTPAGPLLSLPFEVLLTGPARADALAQAPWLVRQFPITHVPAPANFVSLRRIAGTSRATRPWFGFGDFQPLTQAQAQASFPGATCSDSAQLLSGLPSLPYAAKELTAARDILGAHARDELLGPAFTARAVLSTPLNQYRILHFATHALLPTDLHCQTEPAIVTSAPAGAQNAAGALLTSSDIVQLHLDADLVILSACNSGGPGGTTAGESLSGLARAFFYAGARALMVTHWSVNDQVSAYLVADTLRRMQENPGLGTAGALRDAQLAMLAGTGRSLPAQIAHPFFWAPFAVIGESGERMATARSWWGARLAAR